MIDQPESTSQVVLKNWLLKLNRQNLVPIPRYYTPKSVSAMVAIYIIERLEAASSDRLELLPKGSASLTTL
ncbi:hypothetical protein PPE03_26750 [Pseudoalteromonas peptidolytica]|nr:hypothetical protein PPE03_26750 [Pseudoalteromonas peptidolytica]